jgi:hypothetical protein
MKDEEKWKLHDPQLGIFLDIVRCAVVALKRQMLNRSCSMKVEEVTKVLIPTEGVSSPWDTSAKLSFKFLIHGFLLFR